MIPILLKNLFLILMGFGSGVVISGAVFAFIAIIGVVPRLAQKTKTGQYIKLYEEALIIGGIFGATVHIVPYSIALGPLGIPVIMLLALCLGVFYGCMAVSLAEVLDVIPILTRRIRIQKGMFWFILALALGKLAGSILYSVIPGFFTPD